MHSRLQKVDVEAGKEYFNKKMLFFKVKGKVRAFEKV